jgi:hypothetical protein
MAPNGHDAMSELSPLSGVKRKLDFGAVRSVDDPFRKSQHNIPDAEERRPASRM